MNNSTHHDASQYLIARYIELRGIPTAYRPGRPNSNHKEDPIPVKIKRVSVPGSINAIRTTSDIRFTRVDGTSILIKEVLRGDFEQLLVGAGDAVTSREVGKCIQLYMSYPGYTHSVVQTGFIVHHSSVTRAVLLWEVAWAVKRCYEKIEEHDGGIRLNVHLYRLVPRYENLRVIQLQCLGTGVWNVILGMSEAG